MPSLGVGFIRMSEVRFANRPALAGPARQLASNFQLTDPPVSSSVVSSLSLDEFVSQNRIGPTVRFLLSRVWELAIRSQLPCIHHFEFVYTTWTSGPIRRWGRADWR